MAKKRSFLIIDGHLPQLIKDLTVELGFPIYTEELVIYFQSQNHFEITITNKHFSWGWHDVRAVDNIYGTQKNNIKTGMSSLKEKMLFLSDIYGDKGIISIAKVYKFQNDEIGIVVEIRPSTLVDSILSISLDPLAQTSKQLLKYYALLRRKLSPHIKHCGLLEKIKNVDADPENIIYRKIGYEPILSSKILDFCKKNGILNYFKNPITYREVLSSKSNDYGLYEDIFHAFTGIDLLSADDHCSGDRVPPVSIIIPYYNSESSILKTLLSIESQEIDKAILARCDVVIIDDGSLVPVSRVVDSSLYSFELKIVRIEKNCGASNARSLGVAQSVNDVLIFLDSDIVLSKYYLIDHIVRHQIINNAVLVSFKKNIKPTDPALTEVAIQSGIENLIYFNELRVTMKLTSNALGSYSVDKPMEIHILEPVQYLFRSKEIKAKTTI